LVGLAGRYQFLKGASSRRFLGDLSYLYWFPFSLAIGLKCQSVFQIRDKTLSDARYWKVPFSSMFLVTYSRDFGPSCIEKFVHASVGLSLGYRYYSEGVQPLYKALHSGAEIILANSAIVRLGYWVADPRNLTDKSGII
jgi:hypothetical protein